MYSVLEDRKKISKQERVTVKIMFGAPNAAAVRQNQLSLKHESEVLEILTKFKVENTPRLYKKGLYPLPHSDTSILIMKDIECGEDHRELLPSIDSQDFRKILIEGIKAMVDIHAMKIMHGNIKKDSIYYDWVTKEFLLGCFKYATIRGIGPEHLLKQIARKHLVLVDGNFQVNEMEPSSNPVWKDAADFGAVMLELLSRGSFLSVSVLA